MSVVETADRAGDPIRDALAEAGGLGLLEDWTATGTSQEATFWTEHRPPGAAGPQSGFKIHLSASIGTAGAVLARALPILAAHRTPFKHAASLQELAFLSSGRGGLTQIGKFLTAYPPDAAQAADLARALHAATDGLAGPRIRSEAAFASGSLVHYRYGGFARRSLQRLTGRVVPARVGADGVLEPDERGEAAAVPEPAQAPFPDAAAPEAHLLRGRYVRVQPLHRSPKGATWLGFDTSGRGGDLLVIKEAYAYVMEASDGLDARERLRRETRALRALQGSGLTPELRDAWDDDRSAFLVYDFIDGRAFAEILNGLGVAGLRPTQSLLRDWSEKLCALVSQVHRRGYVIGDFKPANLILSEAGFRLIDLELAGPADGQIRGGMGTRGYVSPQQADRHAAAGPLDDVFSLGATLLAAATAGDCSMLPDPLAVARLERMRDPRNPFFPIIETCLAQDPAERFSSADAVADALRKPRSHRPTQQAPAPRVDFRQLAIDVGDLLVASAIREDGRAWWLSPHPIVGGAPIRDLYAGASGPALFLCALHAATGAARYLDLARDCARWLADPEPTTPCEGDMPGLYYGICGPGLVFLRLHQITREAQWRDEAIRVAEEAARMPAHSPDLMTGQAGTGLFKLALWKAGGGRRWLELACQDARALLASRDPARPVWTIPPGHESLSGGTYIGFAHGSAGVGYFLAECALASGADDIAAASLDLADWLVGLGRPCLADDGGFTWGATPDDTPAAVNWCHGAPGVARFLAKAHELGGAAAHLAAAEQAARMIAHTAWHGTTQCHGLAGNADVLIDVWRASGHDVHLDAARRLGENLALFRTADGWPSEELSTVCPDLMVGQAGVGAAFLRLADPHLPHLVSV